MDPLEFIREIKNCIIIIFFYFGLAWLFINIFLLFIVVYSKYFICIYYLYFVIKYIELIISILIDMLNISMDTNQYYN